MEMVLVIGIGIGRENQIEMPAGLPGGVAQEIRARTPASPILLDLDQGAVVQLKGQDVDGFAKGVLALPLAVALGPAIIGSGMVQAGQAAVEMLVGQGRKGFAFETGQGQGRAAGHMGRAVEGVLKLARHEAILEPAAFMAFGGQLQAEGSAPPRQLIQTGLGPIRHRGLHGGRGFRGQE